MYNVKPHILSAIEIGQANVTIERWSKGIVHNINVIITIGNFNSTQCFVC